MMRTLLEYTFHWIFVVYCQLFSYLVEISPCHLHAAIHVYLSWCDTQLYVLHILKICPACFVLSLYLFRANSIPVLCKVSDNVLIMTAGDSVYLIITHSLRKSWPVSRCYSRRILTRESFFFLEKWPWVNIPRQGGGHFSTVENPSTISRRKVTSVE
jgi:hypothetical protein